MLPVVVSCPDLTPSISGLLYEKEANHKRFLEEAKSATAWSKYSSNRGLLRRSETKSAPAQRLHVTSVESRFLKESHMLVVCVLTEKSAPSISKVNEFF